MSHFTAASVLLLLSLPHGFAAPSPPSEFPAFHFVNAKNPAVAHTSERGQANVHNSKSVQHAHVSDLTDGPLAPSNFFKALSNSVPNEPGPEAFDGSQTIVHPLPRQKLQAVANGTTVHNGSTADLISLLGTLSNTMGDFFVPRPSEKEPPIPVVDDNLDQFLEESAAQESGRPAPFGNRTTIPPVNGTRARTNARTIAKTNARTRARTVRGRRAAGPQVAPYPIPSSKPTPALPPLTLPTLLKPFFDIIATLLGNLPIVGGLVPKVPVAEAMRMLANPDVSGLDPAYALGSMVPLLSVARNLLHGIPVPAHAAANRARIASLLAGFKQRSLASMDSSVAIDLVQKVLGVLLNFVRTLPVTGKAVEGVPMSTVMSVATRATGLSKRDNIDPSILTLLLQQILNTTTTILKDVPLLGNIVSLLPLDKLQLDKIPLPQLPLDAITALIPLGDILSNLPLGGIPGIITRRDFPLPGLHFDIAAGLIPQLLGLAVGLAQNAPIISEVAALLPNETVTNITGAYRQRLLSDALPLDSVTGLVQRLLSLALGLAKNVQVVGDAVNKVPLDAATKIVDGLNTRDVENGLPLDVVTRVVSKLLELALGLTSIPITGGLNNATSPINATSVASSFGKDKRQLPGFPPVDIVGSLVQQLLNVILSLTKSLPALGDLTKGLPLGTTTSGTGKEKRQLPGLPPLDIVTDLVQQLLGLTYGLTTATPIASILNSTVPLSNVTRRLRQKERRDAGLYLTPLEAFTSVLQTTLGLASTSVASAPNGLEKKKRDDAALPIPLDALTAFVQSILGITNTLTSSISKTSSGSATGLGKRADPVLPDPLKALNTLLQSILNLAKSIPVVGDILSQIPLGTVPGIFQRREALTQEQQILLATAMAKHAELTKAVEELQALQHGRFYKRQLGVDLGGLTLFLAIVHEVLTKLSALAKSVPTLGGLNLTTPVNPVALLSKILDPTSLISKLTKLPSGGLPVALPTNLPAALLSGLTSGGSSGGLPTTLPAGLPAGLLAALTSGALPSSLPAGLPAGLPVGLPAGLPVGLPAGLPVGLPVGLPAGLPVGLPAGLPIGLPVGLPVGLPFGKFPRARGGSLAARQALGNSTRRFQNATAPDAGLTTAPAPVPLTPRDEPTYSSLTSAMTPDFSYDVVHDFITKWHTVGAALNKTDPELVDGLMAVFNDPASAPLPFDAHYLGKFPEKVRTFVYEYSLFAQVINDNAVPQHDKVDILKLLFDNSVPRSERNDRKRRGFSSSVEELSNNE